MQLRGVKILRDNPPQNTLKNGIIFLYRKSEHSIFKEVFILVRLFPVLLASLLFWLGMLRCLNTCFSSTQKTWVPCSFAVVPFDKHHKQLGLAFGLSHGSQSLDSVKLGNDVV